MDGTALWDHYGQGTGVIRDLISSRDLLIVGTIESGQSRPGFDRERFIQLTHGSSESLSTAYDPADGAVAVLFDFEVTQSAGTQTIVQLGNRTRHPAGADCWCG